MEGILDGRVLRGVCRLRSYIPHVPFDIHTSELYFPRVMESFQDDLDEWTEAIEKRRQDLKSPIEEQDQVAHFVAKILNVLTHYQFAPGTLDLRIQKLVKVGSFRKGTMLKGHNVADIVIVLKTLPTVEATLALGNKIVKLQRMINANDVLKLDKIDGGFQISSPIASVKCLVTTVPENFDKLDPELHFDKKLVRMYLAATCHADWFEKEASPPYVRDLILLLKDLQNRCDGLKPLNPWILDLLAHYAINHPDNEALSVEAAFIRCLQLLSGGIFLPGSFGIRDPCKSRFESVHIPLSWEQQDLVCLTSQSLLRVLAHGGAEVLERTQDNLSGRIEGPTGAVFMSPIPRVFQSGVDAEQLDACVQGNK